MITLLVNGYPNIKKSKALALSLAQCGGKELTALFIIDSAWDDMLGDEWISDKKTIMDFYDYFEEGLKGQARTALQDICRAGGIANLEVYPVIQKGSPEKVILSYCSHLGPNGLFIIPLTPRLNEGGVKLNMNRLTKKADCPLLMVPESKKYQNKK